MNQATHREPSSLAIRSPLRCQVALSLMLALTIGACASEEAAGHADAGTSHDMSEASSAPDNEALDAVDDAVTHRDSESRASERAPMGDPCLNPGTEGATATCLSPTFPPEYYAEQAEKYFDTLDVDADPESVPNYSELVARWEWPPWLLLTAYGSQDMIDTNKALHTLDPSTVPVRDCRAFDVQPFARCTVVFEYDEGPCPIYEEFTFNDAGEMTFIEAWSDIPGLRPQRGDEDPWGETSSLGRLATRVPGLGNAEGRIDLESSWMLDASESDPDVADFALRASDWWVYWYEAFTESPTNFFAVGCGW